MLRSYLRLVAASLMACAVVLYMGSCGEVEVGHTHEHEHKHAEEATNTTSAEQELQKENPSEVSAEQLERAIRNFETGNIAAAQQAVETIAKTYKLGTPELRKRAGETLARHAMEDPSPEKRALAMRWMGVDPQDALEVALLVSKDKEPIVVAAACEVLGWATGNPKARARLQELAEYPDQTIRAAATHALTDWYRGGGREGYEKLVKFLGDPKGDASAKAALALHQSRRKAIPVLIEALQSEKNPRTRAAAAITLACICAGINPTQQKFAEAAQSQRLEGNPHKAIMDGLEPMIRALRNDPAAEVREACAQGLGYLGSEKAAKPLAEALKDPNVNVRRRAASALITVPAKSVQAQIEQALATDSSADVRRYAAEALAWIGDSSVVPALTKALKDPAPQVRLYAAQALGKLGDKRATTALVELFNDPDEDVRWEAVEAVSKLRDPQARDALLAALNDPSPMVSTAAENALRALGIATTRGLHLKKG